MLSRDGGNGYEGDIIDSVGAVRWAERDVSGRLVLFRLGDSGRDCRDGVGDGIEGISASRTA